MIYLSIAVVLMAAIMFWVVVRYRVALQQRDSYRDQVAERDMEAAVLIERLEQQNVAAQALAVSTAQAAERAQVELRRQIEAERLRMQEVFEQQRVAQAAGFVDTFKTLASEVLEAKSQAMSRTSTESVSSMLKPLAQQIDKFRERIEQESKQRFALEKEVGRLVELNMRISQEANNLTSALKGNSKTQGDWGEMILETLLESSGLKRDIHFRTQESIRNVDGELMRPDVVLSLPDQKQVIIDSKVSLKSYIAYTECDDVMQAKVHLAAHVASVRNHVAALGGKNYQELVESPDFVIMFVPNEPAFLLALQGDASLWNFAYSKGVVLSSPTNLFAILRIVDELWRRDSQSKNALEIARQGGELYDKFVGFAEVFGTVGASLDKSQEQYARAMSMLNSGRGNLVRRAESLRQLGIKTSKSLPPQIE